MVVLVAATVLLLYILIQPTQPNSKVYSDFQSDVQSGQVKGVVRDGETLTVTLKTSATYTVESDSPLDGEYAAIQTWLKTGGVSTPLSYEVKKPADTGSSSCSSSSSCAKLRAPTTRP